MIHLDSSTRPTFDTLLHTSRGTVFPESFYSFLHNYVSSLNDIAHKSQPPPATPTTQDDYSTVADRTSSNTLHSASGSVLPNNTSYSQLGSQPSASAAPETPPNQSDHRLEKVWSDYESVEPYLLSDIIEEDGNTNVKIEYTSSIVSKPFQASGRNMTCIKP
jgi:phosphoinositide-3-kinase, regulatory subunit 4